MVEIAPAYGLDEAVRQQLHEDAVKLAKHVGYVRPPVLLPFPSSLTLLRDLTCQCAAP